MNKALPTNLRITKLPASFWVENDSRSVIAMLRGAGDGRHLIYLIFSLLHRYTEPHQCLEETMCRYADIVRCSPRLQKFDVDRCRFRFFIFLVYGLVLIYHVLDRKQK